jgi:outer membrane protein OmpA-like peptidoglycan-associated protein
MAIDNSTRAVIKKDSSATIRTEGLMGDQYVEILPGSKDSSSVKDGDTLEGQTPLEISDLIQKANGILDTAGGALRNVDATAGNLNSITAKVNKGAGTIGALVNSQKVYQNVEQATEEMKEDLEAAKHNFLLSHFFHKRGYEDTADLTKNEIRYLPPVENASKVFHLDASKIFDKPDTAKVKQEKPMKEAGAWLQSSPFSLVVIAAATDKGDTENDRTLTEARAMVVRNYLVNNFKLDDTKLKTIGLGKTTMLPGGIAVFVYPPGAQTEPNSSKR